MLPVFSHPFRLLCVHPLRRKMDNIFRYISDSFMFTAMPHRAPGDRCDNYGNSVQLASRSMQYVGLDFAASMICFRLLFAFLEQNHLLRVLQSSVAVMVLYFPQTALAHGLRQSGPTSYDDIATMSFYEKNW